MIRFAVILFFFFHLAILVGLPRLAWLGRLTGWGACGIFVSLWLFQVEENSDIVFLVMAAGTGLCMAGAEIAARALGRSKENS